MSTSATIIAIGMILLKRLLEQFFQHGISRLNSTTFWIVFEGNYNPMME